jgi:hypothetical protein
VGRGGGGLDRCGAARAEQHFASVGTCHESDGTPPGFLGGGQHSSSSKLQRPPQHDPCAHTAMRQSTLGASTING